MRHVVLGFALASLALGCSDGATHHTPPDTSIDDKPAAITNQTHVRILFHASGSANRFTCGLDGTPSSCISPFEADVTDGVHNFQVAAALNTTVDDTPATATWRVDTVPPETAILTGPPALDNSLAPEFTFQGSDDQGAVTFECALDDGAFAACTSPASAAVGDGDHRYRVRAVDAAGNADPTPATASWTVDTTAPDTMITSGPAAGAITAADVTFAFGSPDSSASFECSLDGAAFASCTSPRSFTLGEGAHSFAARARDALGQVDPSPAMRAWTVDVTPPAVAITAAPGDPSNSATGSFAFTSSDPTATFACQVDAAAFAPCTSGFTSPSLADGSHTFTVRATDPVGNAASAAFTWTIDTVAPTATITGSPPAATASTTATFTFTTAGAPVAVACSLDGGGFTACTSPRTLTGNAEGMHTFAVRATDAAGNQGSDARTWTVDTTPPVVAITSGPPNPTSDSTPTLAFTVTGATAIDCRTDGGGFAACTSPFTTAALADGSHTVTVRGTDGVGNTATASQTFTVDTVAPAVAVTPVASPTSNNRPGVAFTVTGATTIQCQVDVGAFATCTSPFTPAALADGSHTITVRGTDAAGNVGTGSTTFTVDTAAPVVTVTPVTSPTSNNRPPVSFTVTGATTIQCQVDAGAFATCTSPFTPAALADGSHTITVRGTDAAGNVGTGSTTFTVDTAAPVVTVTPVTSPTNNNTPSVSFTVTGATTIQCQVDAGSFATCTSPFTPAALADGSHTITVRGTDAAGNASTGSTTFTVDTGAPVVTVTPVASPTNNNRPPVTFTVTGATTIQCQVDTGTFATCTSPFTPAALADGSHTITVRGTDAAGNIGTGSTTFTVDTAAPVVTVTPVTSPTNNNRPPVAFTVTGATTIQCQVDTGAFATCTSPFTPAALADGSHTITVRGTDAAGNAGTGSTTFTVDTAAPVVTVTPVASPTNNNRPPVTFTVTGATTIQCQVDTGAFATCTSPFTPAALADGSHTITVRGTDAAGNIGTGATTFTVDTGAPVVTVTPVASPTNNNRPPVSFTVTGATTIQCQVDSGTFATCTSPFTPAALADGSHTITVRGTDAAGNAGTGSTTFTVDATPPPVAFDDTPPAQWPVNYFDMKFHTTDASATLTCSLDGAAFSACASPLTITTSYNVGSTFSVRARDPAGNTTTISTAWTSSNGLVLHYPWEQGRAFNTSLLAQNPTYSPDSTITLPITGGWAGTAAASPPAHSYPNTIRPLSSSVSGSYTASIWVRVSPSSASGTVLSTLTANNGIALTISGRQVSLRVNENNTAFTANTVIPLGRWLQLGLLSNGPGTGLQLLVNGVTVGTAMPPTMTGFGPGQAASMTIGNLTGVDLDDLRFYNRALSSSELCTTLVRGQLNVQGACVPLIPGLELDFENEIRNSGRWGLVLTPPGQFSFVPTRLGSGLKLLTSDQSFGFTGFASQVSQDPGHSFSFWFVAGAAASDTMLDFFHGCAAGAPGNCGIRVSYSTTGGLTVLAGNGGQTAFSRTIAIANGTHSVVVTEQKAADAITTQSLSIYVDGNLTVLPIGAGNVYGNPIDSVVLPRAQGTTVDEIEFWPRDLSLDMEMLCENGWDGEWDPATDTCLFTSN